MITIAKNVTEVERIYTYFEFVGLEEWEDFDDLLKIITIQMQCKVLEKLTGIWSKYCTLQKNDFVFMLMYHEDWGNCLYNIEKKDDKYYCRLERIAYEILSILNTTQ